jgi:oxaloacetate decarboxylase (Na+ extruding) subunit alpha
MNDKMVTFHDTTFRDGPQSLWGMKMNYGMIDAVASEMDQAGFASIETIGMVHWIYWVRFLKENPIAGTTMFERKI